MLALAGVIVSELWIRFEILNARYKFEINYHRKLDTPIDDSLKGDWMLSWCSMKWDTSSPDPWIIPMYVRPSITGHKNWLVLLNRTGPSKGWRSNWHERYNNRLMICSMMSLLDYSLEEGRVPTFATILASGWCLPLHLTRSAKCRKNIQFVFIKWQFIAYSGTTLCFKLCIIII